MAEDVIPKDALSTIGKILPDGVEGRDAVHIAVISATAGHKLFAGQPICYSDGVAFTGKETLTIGIVDPYLEKPVEEGQRFWLHLYPRTITSLKHDWDHPGIPRTDRKAPVLGEARATKAREEAEKYLRNWADEADVNYKRMMDDISEDIDADGNVKTNGYIYLSDLSSSETIENPETFWKSVGLILNKNIKNPPNHFSCSC